MCTIELFYGPQKEREWNEAEGKRKKHAYERIGETTDVKESLLRVSGAIKRGETRVEEVLYELESEDRLISQEESKQDQLGVRRGGYGKETILIYELLDSIYLFMG